MEYNELILIEYNIYYIIYILLINYRSYHMSYINKFNFNKLSKLIIILLYMKHYIYRVIFVLENYYFEKFKINP